MMRVVRVRPAHDHVLQLWFNTGESGFFDVEPYLDGPVFEPLREMHFFNQVQLDDTAGTICWPNGADFCPDLLHDKVVGVPDEARAG
jgi:hypothetical protein